MRRVLRSTVSTLLVALALAAIGLKGWLELDGPHLEALRVHSFCDDAEAALSDGRVEDALELAEAGACADTHARASARWDDLAAVASRCWDGVWTGRGEGGAGVGCAVVSDLVVFGDVRDLTRQGVAWTRGEETDGVLIALSTAGVALTLAPIAGAGNALLKVARRAGTLTRGLGDSIAQLARRGAWRQLAGLLGDAGRIGRTLGPGRGTRALAYAESPAELARLARFVETAPLPLLALRWGGKGAMHLDDALYRAAIVRGPEGIALAARRGGAAMLSRKPLVVAAAKVLYRHPEQVAAWAFAAASWLLRWATWPVVLAVAAMLAALAALIRPPRRRPTGA